MPRLYARAKHNLFFHLSMCYNTHMVYLSDIMQKKVKGWVAVLVIFLLAAIAAWAISAKAATGLPSNTPARRSSANTPVGSVGRSAFQLFFGGTIEAATPCPCPSGCTPICQCGQTLVKLKKQTAGTGFPLFCYSPGTPFVGPPPAPGVHVLGFGPKLSPILFYTSR